MTIEAGNAFHTVAHQFLIHSFTTGTDESLALALMTFRDGAVVGLATLFAKHDYGIFKSARRIAAVIFYKIEIWRTCQIGCIAR